MQVRQILALAIRATHLETYGAGCAFVTSEGLCVDHVGH